MAFGASPTGPGSAPGATGARLATGERILREATFSPSAVRYPLIGMTLVLGITVVGIPLLVVLLPISLWYYRKYYERLRVILTSRDLKVHRGILFTEEKSIPLEKITDLAVYQGPLMRRFGLKGIRVETAGQSSTTGALVSVIGIEDTEGFRDQVLRQRDRITDSEDAADAPQRRITGAGGDAPSGPGEGGGAAGIASGSSGTDPELLATLRSIDETLRRIEHALER